MQRESERAFIYRSCYCQVVFCFRFLCVLNQLTINSNHTFSNNLNSEERKNNRKKDYWSFIQVFGGVCCSCTIYNVYVSHFQNDCLIWKCSNFSLKLIKFSVLDLMDNQCYPIRHTLWYNFLFESSCAHFPEWLSIVRIIMV